MQELNGSVEAFDDMKIAIVVGRFNQMIGKSLLSGAMDGLEECGVLKENVTVAWVPGAFEIPLVAKKFAEGKRYDAVICLGAVIRGETPHFDYVAGKAASGIAKVSLETGLPVIFGVLTTDNLEQAEERSGQNESNKGYEAALAAVEMANLLKDIRENSKRNVEREGPAFAL